ncbi:hypothetical protein, partial [uncultured Prevotella sp.]|uniref:hypothetical protein n=1 Tax=uncultured Prevotella sp. TaxID=159272 RepID=UPI0025EE7EA5
GTTSTYHESGQTSVVMFGRQIPNISQMVILYNKLLELFKASNSQLIRLLEPIYLLRVREASD